MTIGKLTKLIDNLKYEDDKPRDYIGASSIGSECLRQIWYELNCKESVPIPNRIRRIFDTGKLMEGYIIELLRKSGLSLISHEGKKIDGVVYSPNDGSIGHHINWLHFEDKEYPFFQGNCDAIWRVENKFGQINSIIIEIKTAKDSEFQKVVKHGLKKWNPKYYAQIQSYMGMSGINSAYIVVLNKDNSDLYDELVTFDSIFYEGLKEKAKMIYSAKSEPPRINGSALFYMCKMCKFKDICHQ